MESNCFKLNEFGTREALAEGLKERIISSLANAIELRGFATLALSGGTTPLKLLQALSVTAFAWEKVRVTLVDERWVELSSFKSNERLIRENLLINAAKEAKFFGLKRESAFAKESLGLVATMLQEEFASLDVVVLGMGLDGHTASFFPEDEALTEALTTEALLCATRASAEPKERITLSRSFLLRSKNLLLHIEGAEKKELFLRASQSQEFLAMPIISMMRQKEPQLEVYYAE